MLGTGACVLGMSRLISPTPLPPPPLPSTLGGKHLNRLAGDITTRKPVQEEPSARF
jgi:hypothetical protein